MRQSIAFSATGSLGTKLLALVGFIALARLLSPHEFGLMAYVGIVVALADYFLGMGIDAAIIQNREADQRHLSTAFWFQLALSTLAGLSLYLGAGLLAGFFAAPDLQAVAMACAPLLVLKAACIVPFALLQKHKLFERVAIVELVSVASGLGVGLVLALRGYGVWALVVNALVTEFLRLVCCLFLTRWLPARVFSATSLAEIWKFSRYLLGTNLLQYTINNIDNLVVGKLLGAPVLGAYRYAMQIVSMPSQVIDEVFGRVFFTFYSEYQSEPERIKVIHLRAMRVISFFSFPAMLGLSALARPIAAVVLGPQWVEMGGMLELLAITLLFNTVAVLNVPLYLSQGKTRQLFWVSLGMRVNAIAGVLIGIQFGLQGMLVGMLVTRMINILPSLYFAGRLIDVRMGEFLRCLSLNAFTSAGMAAAVHVFTSYVLVDPNTALALASSVAFGVLAYVGLSLLLQREFCSTILVGLRPGRGASFLLQEGNECSL